MLGSKSGSARRLVREEPKSETKRTADTGNTAVAKGRWGLMAEIRSRAQAEMWNFKSVEMSRSLLIVGSLFFDVAEHEVFFGAVRAELESIKGWIGAIPADLRTNRAAPSRMKYQAYRVADGILNLSVVMYDLNESMRIVRYDIH